MNRDNFWNDEKVLDFAKQLLKERLEWAVLHDAAAAPVPMQIQLDKYKASHSIGNEEWEIVEFKKGDQILKLKNGKYRNDLNSIGIENCLSMGLPIHSVLRKKDSVLFTVGDKFFNNAAGYYTEHAIDRFEINGKVMKVMYAKREQSYYEINDIQPLPQRTKLSICSICGGELILIRGRYPNSDKREVCPTCNTERLEQINEISSKTYGVAMQETKLNIEG